MKIEAKYTIEIQGKKLELTSQELWELKQQVLRYLPEPVATPYAPWPMWINPQPIPYDRQIDVWYGDATTVTAPAYIRQPHTTCIN